MKKGWTTKRLGELAEIELGKTPARATASFWDEKKTTDNIWLSIADLLNAEDNVVSDSKEYLTDKGAALCSVVRKGTLLVSFKLTLGRLAFAGRDLYTNEAIAALTLLNEREVSKEYLFWFLQFFDWHRAAEGDVKIKGMTLNKAKLKEIAIEFPPLAEQRRIVGVLDEAFAGLATAQAHAAQNLQNARALFESILDAAINGHVTEGWRESHRDIESGASLLKRILSKRRTHQKSGNGYTEPAPPNIEAVPELPQGWTYATVEQLLKYDGGLSYGILKPGEHDRDGVPMIRVMDIGHGRMNETEIFKVTRKLSDEFRRTILEEDDIMLAVMATVGRCAVVPSHLVGANVNRALAVLKLTKDVSVKFVLFALLSPRIQALFQKNKVGAAQPRINLTELRRYAIPLPPIAEQIEIVKALDALAAETQRLTRLYEQKQAALAALKKSLLHQAFTGEL